MFTRVRCGVLMLFAVAGIAARAQTPPPHSFWSADGVQEIRLTFSQPDWWDQLTANYQGPEGDTPYLEASFQWGSVKFDSIGVRFKGSSSYRVNTNKKPFRLKLNEFVKGQKIDGVAAYNLSNGLLDPSMVREGIYYEMAAALGLKAPRTSFAALYINDQYWGLYVLGEVVNGDFLENYFGKGEDDGNLYKGNIGATFAYLGPDPAEYKKVWEKQSNEDADDWSDLIALCKTLDETPSAQIESVMGKLVDVDSFLTAMALDNATENLDNYMGTSQNFNIYRRPSDGKWVWIVWDPSLAFAAFPVGVSPATEYPVQFVTNQNGGGQSSAQPGGTARPLFTKLMAVPSIQARYLQIYRRLVDQAFVPEKIEARMITLHDMIRPYIVADTQKLMTLAQFDAAITGSSSTVLAVPALQPFVDARVAWLKMQLASANAGGTLTSARNGLSFAMTAGGFADSQEVELSYTGVGTVPTYSVRSATTSGETWLTPLPTGGPLPGSFTVSVKGKGLAAGDYSGSMSVYLSGATDSPVVIPVTLTVTVPATAVAAVTNAASYATGPVSPGEIVTLFGNGLGPANLTLGNTGAEVVFDGITADVIYSRADQVGAVVPMEISGRTSTDVQVRYGDQTASLSNLAVQTAAPGIFTMSGTGTGQGAILNQDTSVNGTSNPAARGSIISIYLTGAGTVNSSNLLTAETRVTIGGQAATIQYAGAAPGSITGLYQINATIPPDAASGELPVVVTVGGASSQAGVTVAVQ